MVSQPGGIQDVPAYTVSSDAPQANQHLETAKFQANNYLAMLRGTDKELPSFHAPAHDLFIEAHLRKFDRHRGAPQDPARMADLAIKACATVAFPIGEAERVWWSHPRAYAKAIKENMGRYTHNGTFDHEGFALACGRTFLEATVQGTYANRDLSNFADTLFLMHEMGILDHNDWTRIQGAGSLDGWQTSCDVSRQFTHDEMDLLNAYVGKKSDFLYKQLTDGANKSSLVSRTLSVDPSTRAAVSDFKNYIWANS